MNTEGTTVFLLLLVIFEAAESTIIERKKQCKEQFTHYGITMNCSHLNLPYIPKIANEVMNLLFSYNNLTNITSETFRNISNPNGLNTLGLDRNKIQNVSKRSLDAFQNLERLYLSKNPIYHENMRNLLGELSYLKFLSHLDISGIHTIEIKKDLFSLMGKNGIELLSVRRYNMKTVSMDVFGNFNSLAVLYLSDNHIEHIQLSKSKHLHNLYLDYNKFKSFPDFSIDESANDCYVPNLEILSLVGNDIEELGFDNFKCLLRLKTLELGQNPIKVLQNNMLLKLPNIKTLQLKYLSGDTLTVEPLAFNSTSLRYLVLRYSRRATDVFVSLNDTFKYLPKLRQLSLGQINMLSLTNRQFTALFSPLANLTLFECFACQISQDPIIILNHMRNVVDFSLHSNLITTLSDETFKENKHLKHLDLTFNHIGHIQESALPVSLLNNLYSLDLSNNPFVCDCNLEWLINWMKTKQYSKQPVLLRYPQEYICLLPRQMSKKRLSDISFTYKECHPWSPWIWVAIIASPCVIVTAIVVLLAYRKRWTIKHYIYLLRKRRNYQIINGHNFVYDVFVGYEAEDSAWVRRRLLPVLEDEVGLKLCIHERDFPAGAFINDNIVTNIDMSEKIILVLTNGFTRSEWCMFELKVAHSKFIKNETELVVILLEKIDGRNMNHSLKVLLETTTYIEWTEDMVGQELFWTKLKNVLKK